jgi:Protein of unknown function (DUF3800)
MTPEAPETSAHYFVDESGDGVLFGTQGRSLLTQDAVPKHFILGLLEVAQPETLALEMEALRKDLLSDPYFKNVPSMQANGGKTATMFHAKDDVPEVRREVFRLLQRHEIKFFAVVRDMRSVLAYELERRRRDESYRYRPDGLYDSTVSRLFKDRLHSYDQCHICFSKRGQTDRTQAFEKALAIARQRFELKWNREIKTQIQINISSSAKDPCLQAVDYLLWALQRYYRAGESRFMDLMWEKVGLVHAVDELDKAPYGNFYTKKKPLPTITGAAS